MPAADDSRHGDSSCLLLDAATWLSKGIGYCVTRLVSLTSHHITSGKYGVVISARISPRPSGCGLGGSKSGPAHQPQERRGRGWCPQASRCLTQPRPCAATTTTTPQLQRRFHESRILPMYVVLTLVLYSRHLSRASEAAEKLWRRL